MTEDGLKFKADGIGIRGHNSYELDIEFYHPVDPDVRNRTYVRLFAYYTGLRSVVKCHFLPVIVYMTFYQHIKLIYTKIDVKMHWREIVLDKKWS